MGVWAFGIVGLKKLPMFLENQMDKIVESNYFGHLGFRSRALLEKKIEPETGTGLQRGNI